MNALRLKEQFSVDAIWTTEDSKKIAKDQAVSLLKMKGCNVFRHTESYDKERDQSLLRTDGWITEECESSENVCMIEGAFFYE